MYTKYRRLIIFLAPVLLLGGIVAAYLYIVRSDPHYYLKFQEPGEEYFNKGQFKEAAEEFEKAVKTEPDRFETHYSLGLAYLKTGRLNEAAKELVRAVELNPGDIAPRYSLAVAFQRMGKFDLALKTYYIVLKMKPGSPHQVFNNVGTIYLAMKDYEKAVYAFRRAIELKKDYYPAYINMARTYEAQGKKGLAIREYQKIQEMASAEPKSRPYAEMAERQLASLRTR